MKIFNGNAHPKLAHDVADALGVEVGHVDVHRFSDGEIKVSLEENVRGCDCFIVQPTCPPDTNRNLMELLIMIDTLHRSSAGRITAVMPYYGYARQDKRMGSRSPLTAALVASLVECAGADRVMMIDLHSDQIQGFFKCPVDNLYAKPVLLKEVQHVVDGPMTIVSPDAGGTERARAYAKKLDAPLAIIDKRRERANTSEVMHIIGDVAGQTCVIVDDMADTAGTLCKGVDALMKAGAQEAIAAITHPVLSGDAYKNMGDCTGLTGLITTDTIPLMPLETALCRSPAPSEVFGRSKIRAVSIAPLLAEAIRRTHNEESISALFK